MINLLKHLGYEEFHTLHVQHGLIEVCRCFQLKLTTEKFTGTEIANTIDQIRSVPLLTYNEEQWKQLCELEPTLALARPVIIIDIVRNCYPTLDHHELSNSLIEGLPESLREHAQKSCAVFLRCVEKLARLEPRILGQLARLLIQSRQPLAELVFGIQKYLTIGTPLRFMFPPVREPQPPSNVVGSVVFKDTGAEARPVENRMIKEVFEEGGALNRFLDDFEVRPQQIEMAEKIGEAFNSGRHILAEAGTGTGKSLAYLVPAIIWSRVNEQSGEQVVVSTHTKNLQDQLFYKDLPQLLGAMRIPFRAVLAKGRNNYLCIKKWKNLLSDPSHWSVSEREKLMPIFFWQQTTLTGDITECHGFALDKNRYLWNRLASESGYCQAQKCNATEDCFVKKMRDEIKASHIVVVNHSLLFSDLLAERAILGPYRNLVIDEAHHLEKTAQQYLGVEFSFRGLKGLSSTLYEKDRMESGLLVDLRKMADEGVGGAGSSALISNSISSLNNWIEVSQQSFRQWSQTAQAMTAAQASMRQRFRQGESPMLQNDEELDLFRNAGDDLVKSLGQVLSDMDFWEGGDREQIDEYRQVLAQRMEEIVLMMETSSFLAESSDENFVYWFDVSAKDRNFDLRFYAVPLNIADILEDRLLSVLRTCVFSSATLSVANSFDYYKSRVGLDKMGRGSVIGFTAPSPFDYGRHCRLIIPSFVSDPSSPAFAADCSNVIRRVAVLTRRSTMALFTSYALLDGCYRSVRADLLTEGIPCFGQGLDGSRTWLTQQFKSNRGSVLFGTDSFWEGVDMSGETLEVLIITKLPFEVPTDPLVAAKMERIDESGGRSFFDYSVPEAVIKLKQGFGRLIRSQSDRGVVIILDKRIIHKSYGRVFLESLPVEPSIVKTEHEFDDQLMSFFGPSDLAVK